VIAARYGASVTERPSPHPTDRRKTIDGTAGRRRTRLARIGPRGDATTELRRERRSNDEWVAALGGTGEGSALAARDLETFLRRIVGRAAGDRLGAAEEDLDEIVQESLAAVVASLASFRGDSAFTTWAAGIAIRVAFTEIRRRSVRAGRMRSIEAVEAESGPLASASEESPGEAVARGQITHSLERAIATVLTERQRLAVLAELRGVPTVEIAERLRLKPNALYKLLHDARKKLRRALLAEGFTAESMHESARGRVAR